MSPYDLYLLLFSVAATGVGFYTYFSNQKDELNRIFFWCAVVWGYWHLIEFGLHTSETMDKAVAWSVLGAFRLVLLPLILHFVMLSTGESDVRKKKTVHFALYAPALVFCLAELAGLFFWYELVRFDHSWLVDRKNIVLSGCILGWALTLMALCVLSAVVFFRTSSNDKKRSAALFSGMVGVLTLVGMVTFVLDSLFLKFPGLFGINGATVMVVFSSIAWYHNFHSFSPMTAAEEILNAVPEALLITSVDGNVLRINPKAEEVTGYPGSEAYSLHIDTFFEPGFYRGLFAGAASAKNGSCVQETMMRGRSGSELPVVVSAALIHKTKKRVPVAMVISCHDSSFERKALDEFRKTEQLEALGFLAGGIAHDFNNLLTSIVTYLSLARNTEQLTDSVKQKLEKVDAAAHLVINLNRQLAAISKGAKPKKECCSIKEIIESAVQLGLSGSTVECHCMIPENLHAIEADATQLHQVFLNLLVNARQAMERGGIAGIICRNIEVDDRPWVEVVVSDQGCGIPDEKLSDIFKPFYTTKEHGTGLGLSVVKSVVEKHGGTIEVATRRNVGSTFTVRLPSRDVENTGQPEPETECAASSQKGRILVMDDDESVKRAITLMLAEKGHSVTGVDHGAAAIAAYLKNRSDGTPFDLVILDVTIRNGYGAQEVVRRLHEIDPNTVAIVMSGYLDDVLMREYRTYGFVDVIPKPFDLDRIYRVVDRALVVRQAEPA